MTAPKGQDTASRLTIEYPCIRCRLALRIEQPARWCRKPLVEENSYLSFGDDTGADVEHHGISFGWNTNAQRIGADASHFAARGGDAATEAVVVYRGHERHLVASGSFRVLAKPSNVP